MIDACLSPYADEIYYSLLARANARWRFPSRHTMSELAYQHSFVAASLELPGHVAAGLASLLPKYPYSVDQVIDQHTLLPLFAPFLPVWRAQRLREDMHGSHGASIYVRAGLKASRVPSPANLRYCESCANADRRRVGETYWHRVHQIVGVELCPDHGEALRNAHARESRVHTSYEYIAAEDVVLYHQEGNFPVSRSVLDEEVDEMLCHPVFAFVSQNAAWLLKSLNLGLGLAALHHRYHDLLTRCDLTVRGGRVRMQEVVEMFMQRIPVAAQRRLHCELARDSADHWLARLLRTPRTAQHPLHHLLVMYTLDVPAPDFFAACLSSAPSGTSTVRGKGNEAIMLKFGMPPWPCLNPASDHYRAPRILAYEAAPFRYVRGRMIPPPRARFSCDCGFVYLRTGPDRTDGDRFRYDQVERYGLVWEQHLAQLWSDATMSVYAIAKRLHVDPRTIQRYAARAGLADRTPSHSLVKLLDMRKQTKDYSCDTPASPSEGISNTADKVLGATMQQMEYRKVWSEVVASHAAEGSKRLRQRFPAIYMWLYRHDREWLQAHTPPRRTPRQSRIGRVDWEIRDEQLTLAVQEAAQRLLSRESRPVRLSKSALMRETGRSSMIFQQLGKLPQTAAMLALMSESRDAFARRRVQGATTHFVRAGVIPPRWLLERRAGVERQKKGRAIAQAVTEGIALVADGLQQNKIC